MFIQTTTLTIESTTPGTDKFGDEEDSYVLVDAEVPAHLTETSKNVFNPTEGRWETIRIFKALIPGGRALQRGWRVTDEKSLAKYWVDHTNTLSNFVAPDAVTTVDLTEVAPATR